MITSQLPACWSWPVTAEHLEEAFRASGEDSGRAALRLLEGWQAGRCAACGITGPLEADHDHDTGYLRGFLCLSCNRLEAHASDDRPVFARYRFRQTVAMLGLSVWWAAPDSARATCAVLGDVGVPLQRHQAERDPARRR